ncbi:MAG: hypothetical protein KC438_03880 [Thermomicrobiales bacterium]|nr:hypothetical protein [Thermomicrobiales bacterium]MCO5222088.1 hypothetical protein [Thermomicrobiales bacterium]
MKLVALFALAFILMSGPREAILQQEESPGTVTPITCAVTPLSQERLDELAAIAAASPEANGPSATPFVPEGVDVPPEMRLELQAAFYRYQACVGTGDLARIYALFTERFIVEHMASQGTIVSGSSSAPPREGVTDQERFIIGGVLMADGRVAVKVGQNAWGGNPQLYVFAYQDDRWLIDSITSYKGMTLIEPDA